MKKIIFLTALSLLCANIFSAAMDLKVRSVPKETSELVFKSPKEGLPLVVKHLTSGGTGSVKAMHDWICDNIAYDSEMYFSGRISKQDYESVLKKKKAVCSGYSALMAEMCRLAGIEAIVIEGYSKGFGYQGKLGEKTDHAWNAVKMNGKWQLIDVTWDAGYLDRKTFVKRYTTQWFNRSPAQFIYSHLPKDNEYQYLSEPKTKEEFVSEPYIPGIFFEYGLSLGNRKPNYSNEITESSSYDFKLTRSGIAVSADLVKKDGGTGEVKDAVWTDRIGNRVSIDVDVPDAANYKVLLKARNRAEAFFPDMFSISEFEGRILPMAQQFLNEKKILQKEYDYLEKSYFKVLENGRYYLAEDLFDSARNAAVKKILKMVYKDSVFSENVLYFDIKASEDYEGYGNGTVRFPSVFKTYMETSNTHLISPLAGILQKGSSQKFEIESKDYSGIALSAGNSLVPFVKDPKTGIWSLEFEIPEDSEQIVIYGSSNGRNYSGLWSYELE
ncbi:MAG: transglutaminase domain-containing protein [Treponema sp.]|nr:transglutaminase domain-containing protein [Treponema sp.]